MLPVVTNLVYLAKHRRPCVISSRVEITTAGLSTVVVCKRQRGSARLWIDHL